MKRMAALAAMALVLVGCDAVDCAGTMDNRCMDPGYAKRMQENRAKMTSHFTADAEIKRIEIERMTFGEGVTVVHDDRRGVTCWAFSGVQRGGFSCLPDWMLTPADRIRIGATPMILSLLCVAYHLRNWPA